MVKLSTLLTIALCCIGLVGTASAQESIDPALAQQVADDFAAMQTMTAEQRNRFRDERQSGLSREQRRAYQRAFKALRENLGTVPAVAAPNKVVPLSEPRSVAVVPRPKVAGTNITYDTGMVFGTAGTASQMVGNRFDTARNVTGVCCSPVEVSGSITMITFDMVNTFFGSAVWSLYSNIMGTTAMQVTSMARPGIMTGLNTLNIAAPTTMNTYMNGAFLAGIWQFDPTMTGLAVDTGSTAGQGFHAISLNDGAVGTMLTTVTTAGMGLNAIFRVSGNVATPVELMNFTIE